MFRHLKSFQLSQVSGGTRFSSSQRRNPCLAGQPHGAQAGTGDAVAPSWPCTLSKMQEKGEKCSYGVSWDGDRAGCFGQLLA